MNRYSRLGLIFAAVYLAIFVYAEFLSFPYLIANSPLWGVELMLITMPWCLIFAPLFNTTAFIHWYHRFASTPVLYGFFASLPMVLGAIVNAVILYYIGKTIGRASAKNKEQTAAN